MLVRYRHPGEAMILAPAKPGRTGQRPAVRRLFDAEEDPGPRRLRRYGIFFLGARQWPPPPRLAGR